MMNQIETFAAKIDKLDIAEEAQLFRIEKYLRKKPEAGLTCSEAKNELEVYHLPARIFTLRHEKRLNIILRWVLEISSRGVKHRVGRYFLLPGQFKENIHA